MLVAEMTRTACTVLLGMALGACAHTTGQAGPCGSGSSLGNLNSAIDGSGFEDLIERADYKGAVQLLGEILGM